MLSMVSVSSHLKTSKSMSSTLAKLAGCMSLVLQKQHNDEVRENGEQGNDVSTPTHVRGEADDISLFFKTNFPFFFYFFAVKKTNLMTIESQRPSTFLEDCWTTIFLNKGSWTIFLYIWTSKFSFVLMRQSLVSLSCWALAQKWGEATYFALTSSPFACYISHFISNTKTRNKTIKQKERKESVTQ